MTWEDDYIPNHEICLMKLPNGKHEGNPCKNCGIMLSDVVIISMPKKKEG